MTLAQLPNLIKIPDLDYYSPKLLPSCHPIKQRLFQVPTLPRLYVGLGSGINPVPSYPMGAVSLRTGVKHISHSPESKEKLKAMWKFRQWLCQWDFHWDRRWQKGVGKNIASRGKSMSESQRHEVWYMSKSLTPGSLSSPVLYHPSPSALLHIYWVPTMSRALVDAEDTAIKKGNFHHDAYKLGEGPWSLAGKQDMPGGGRCDEE